MTKQYVLKNAESMTIKMQNQGQLKCRIKDNYCEKYISPWELMYIKNIKSKLLNQNHYEINKLVREEK